MHVVYFKCFYFFLKIGVVCAKYLKKMDCVQILIAFFCNNTRCLKKHFPLLIVNNFLLTVNAEIFAVH